MANLSSLQRQEIWVDLMRQASSNGEIIGVNKQDLRAAVDALDTWISDNAAAINSALPAAARTGLSAGQKAILFSYVATKRYVTGA